MGEIIASPLTPILAPLGERLPRVFRDQFLGSAPGQPLVLVRGTMDEIWYPKLLSPLFWLLGRAGILVPSTGGAIPTVLEIISGRDAEGRPFQRWNRTFDLPGGRQHHFDTKVVYDEALGCAADVVGAGDFLYLAWSLTFTPPGTLEIRRQACAVQLGGRRLWLPGWLWKLALGRETFHQWADGEDRIRIELAVDHPLFGRVFVYCGAFRVTPERI